MLSLNKIKRVENNDFYDGYRMKRKEVVLYFLIGGVGFSIIGYLFYKNFFVAAVFFFLPLLFLKPYQRMRLKEEKEKLNFCFKDALYGMSASVAAGRSLGEAISDAEENLRSLYGEEQTITKEFSLMKGRILYTNESPEQVMMEFGMKTELEDIRNFAEICSICVKTGGDLEKAMGKAVSIITDKINLRREVSALTAQKKLEVKLLTGIPFFVLAFLQLTSSDYMNVLYETILGRLIMTGCLLAVGSAYVIGERITDIEI